MGPDEIFDNDSDTEFLEQDDFDPIEDGTDKQILIEGDEDFEFMDDSLNDIDFSEFKGDFKSSLKQINGKLKNKRPNIKKIPVKNKRPKKPLNKTFGVKQGKRVLHGAGTEKTITKIDIPREREVVVQGIDDFMLSNEADADYYKNIGYYDGKKLKELNLTFNNNSALDFNLELFNPSMPLDYLYSTSGNLNNKIKIGGGNATQYSDMLFYMLGNPTLIPSVRIVVSGPSLEGQMAQGLIFKNKSIAGEQIVDPVSVPQLLDTMQFQSSVVVFDVMGQLNRPFIPDGMDVINYTVLAGMTVTLCFYYKQKQLKKFFWKEAKEIAKFKQAWKTIY